MVAVASAFACDAVASAAAVATVAAGAHAASGPAVAALNADVTVTVAADNCGLLPL